MVAPDPSPNSTPTLTRQLARGSAWTVAARWLDRLTGLVATIILARLLSPTDYGIVAIATLFVRFVEIFARTGQGAALVRHPNPTREHYDSAWTLSLGTGLLLGIIIWALVPLATIYFQEPRSAVVIQILALRTVLAGAQNIAILNLQRNLNFRKQTWFTIIPPLSSFLVTIIAAIVLRNYWALVIGLMTECVVSLALSYAMVPYRPRISFAKIPELWSFSVWYLWRSIGSWFAEKLDQFAVGGVFGAGGMGRYTVAGELAVHANRDIAGSVVTVFYPVMAKAQGDRPRMRELYLTVLYWTALISVSTGVGVALVSNDMVDLVLGSQWGDIKPLMPWFALSYGLLSIGNNVYTALTVIGMVRKVAFLQWTRLIGMALTIFPIAFYLRDLEMVATTRFAVTLVFTPTLLYAAMAPFGVSLRDYAATLWRPFVAGAAMAAAVLTINATLPIVGNMRLILDVFVGGVIFGGTVMILWWMIGQPNGPERELWTRVIARIGSTSRNS